MDDLVFTETLQAEHLGVGGQGVGLQGVAVGHEHGLHVALPVLLLVLVLLIQANLRRGKEM